MKKVIVLAAAMALLPALAYAQDITLIPADQVQAAADYLPAAIGAAIMALLARFVGPFVWVLKVARVDQIVIANIKGVIDEFLDNNPSIRANGITVSIKNAMIAEVANRVIAVAPGWLIGFMGGPDGVRQKIRNRLPDALKDVAAYIPLPATATQ
jgi:hypothetical protein